MDKQILADELNKIINGYYARQYALVGDRYFEVDYINFNLLSDEQLVTDILNLIKNGSKILNLAEGSTKPTTKKAEA